MQFLGIGVIDKFLSRMECRKIRFITIQPNLDLCSIYETTIEKMLHEYDFGLQIIHEDNSIVLLAQSNRIVDKKDGDMAVEKIDSSDIQDSARIEQDSDQVRVIYSNIKLDYKPYMDTLLKRGKLRYNSENIDENYECMNFKLEPIQVDFLL